MFLDISQIISHKMVQNPGIFSDIWNFFMNYFSKKKKIRKMLVQKDGGEINKWTPCFILPCSIRPVITSPTPLILCTPETDILKIKNE